MDSGDYEFPGSGRPTSRPAKVASEAVVRRYRFCGKPRSGSHDFGRFFAVCNVCKVGNRVFHPAKTHQVRSDFSRSSSHARTCSSSTKPPASADAIPAPLHQEIDLRPRVPVRASTASCSGVRPLREGRRASSASSSGVMATSIHLILAAKWLPSSVLRLS